MIQSPDSGKPAGAGWRRGHIVVSFWDGDRLAGNQNQSALDFTLPDLFEDFVDLREGARRAGDMVQANGPQLVKMVKRNPLPVALLVGSGLILLLYRPRDEQRSRGISTETPPL